MRSTLFQLSASDLRMCPHWFKETSVRLCLWLGRNCLSDHSSSLSDSGRRGRFVGQDANKPDEPINLPIVMQSERSVCDNENSSEESWADFQIYPPTNKRNSLESILDQNNRCSNSSPTRNQTMHIGESSLFSWLLSDQLDSNGVHRTLQPKQHIANTVYADLGPNNKHLFITKELEQYLLDSFAQNFLPIYPVVVKAQIIDRWRSNSLSPLLKQCILFIGAIHSQESVLTKAGFPCRKDATELLYCNARALYDNDIEMDRITIIQSAFMLQFRFGPSPNHRDCFWWASVAVNLAQTVGMHRSTKGTLIPLEDQRLWKKIWWLLFVRHKSSVRFFPSSVQTNLWLDPWSSTRLGGRKTISDQREWLWCRRTHCERLCWRGVDWHSRIHNFYDENS